MKNRLVLSWIALTVLSFSALGQQRNSLVVDYSRAASLQDLVNDAAHTALTKFADKKLTEAQLSITLIDLRDAQHPVTASFRGNERVYPASVVKLFYFVAVHRWLETLDARPAVARGMDFMSQVPKEAFVKEASVKPASTVTP